MTCLLFYLHLDRELSQGGDSGFAGYLLMIPAHAQIWSEPPGDDESCFTIHTTHNQDPTHQSKNSPLSSPLTLTLLAVRPAQ